MAQELQPLPTRRTATSPADTVGTHTDIEIVWRTLTLLIESVRELTDSGGTQNTALQTILQELESLSLAVQDLDSRIQNLEAIVVP